MWKSLDFDLIVMHTMQFFALLNTSSEWRNVWGIPKRSYGCFEDRMKDVMLIWSTQCRQCSDFFFLIIKSSTSSQSANRTEDRRVLIISISPSCWFGRCGRFNDQKKKNMLHWQHCVFRIEITSFIRSPKQPYIHVLAAYFSYTIFRTWKVP